MLATIPQKIGENKGKVSLLSKLKSIPCDGKVEQSSVTTKALTTPRHKKCPPNAEPFHSVQNPKVKIAMPKNTVVSKALAFQTPKKSEKSSFKCHSGPTLDNCSEMKLEISSQAKKAPRNFLKSSKCSACDSNCGKPASSSPRKPQKRTLKLHKSRIQVPSKYLKEISKPNVQRFHNSVPQKNVDADSSDMEINSKSRNGSMEACPASNGHEESLKDASSMISEVTKLLSPSEKSSTRGNSLPNSEKDFKENHLFEVSNVVVGGETKIMEITNNENATDNTSAGSTNTTEEFPPSSDEYCTTDNSLSNSEEKVLHEKDPIFQTSSSLCDEKSYMESGDKENTVEETNVTVLDSKAEVPSSEASNGVVDMTEPKEIAEKENATAVSNRNRYHS